MSDYDAFAPIYSAWATHMTADIPHYVDLATAADGLVVELAVGTGRVAVPVAAAIRRRVIGIDSSPAMLALAREAAAAAGVDLDLRLADMRDLVVDEPAALIYCPFRSLMHLPTWRDRRRTFEAVGRALQPGGRFAWNAFVYDPHFVAEHDGTTFRHGDTDIWEHVVHDPTDNRMDITAFVGEPGLEPRTIPLWWLTRSEWEGLIDVAGLQVEALYGGFERQAFTSESREFVWVTRKVA